MRLININIDIDIDIDKVIGTFEQQGTKFRSFITKRVIPDDHDAIKFRWQESDANLALRKKLDDKFKQ